MGKWKNQSPCKKVWSQFEISFLRAHWKQMKNKEMADMLGLKLTIVRTKMYEMGLYRMILEYWTEEQVQFLRDNYQTIGDKELAKIMQERWPKQKTWHLKHIEKKRGYLKLNRTQDEIKAIHQRNVDNGCFTLCPVKRWLKTGIAPEGEIRMWREHKTENSRLVPRIKVNGAFVHWARYTWEQAYGPVPKGMNIVFKDDNPANYEAGLDNLEMISDGELSRRNSRKSSQGLSDNYIVGMLTHGQPELREAMKGQKELIELKRLQLQLNRKINATSSREETTANAQ